MEPHNPEGDIRIRAVLTKENDHATCTVLQVGDISIMFDCGIDEKATPEALQQLTELARKVNFILLSHASFQHVGALPFLGRHKVLDSVS